MPTIEQLKQAVAELLASAYPAQAMRDTMMENFQKAPIANTVEYWESIRQSLAAPQALAERTSRAAGGGTGDYEIKDGDGGGVMITRYNGRIEMETMEVPSQIDGKPVTGIGKDAFAACDFKTVTIPDSVTFIGEKAFSSCHFEKLHLGSGIEVIERYAFYNNDLSGTITLPGSVKVIDSLAFGSNQNLSEIVVPDGITVAKDAFSKKTKVVNASGEAPAVQIKAEKPKYIKCACGYDYPADVWFCTKCGARTALAEPVVDPSLNPDNTFEARTISDQRKRVEKFTGARFLAEQKAKMYNANIARKDGDWLFKTSDNIVTITGYEGKGTTVEIPSLIQGMPVVEIGERAFSDKGLTKVIIPNSVKTIGERAFHTNKLTSITIPGTVSVVGRSAFAWNELTAITIEEGVQSIGEDAFEKKARMVEDRSDIANVVIPASVKTIGKRAFYQARIAGVTISKGVEVIGEQAFFRNQLKSVVIPEGVREIGEQAFELNFIESVSLPNSLLTIGDGAFSGGATGNRIAALTLPPNLETLGDGAFSGNLLTEIVIPGNIATVSEGAFMANQLSGVKMREGVKSIEKGAFTKNKLERWQDISFPASLTTIGEKAFEYNQITGDITIPETIKAIGEDAFRKNQITGVEIRGPVKLGMDSFCKNKISKLIIGSRVQSIGVRAFNANEPLADAVIPEGVKKIFYTPIVDAAFASSVFIERGETDAFRFNDTACWQALEQKIQKAIADREAKKPTKPVTFHDRTGAMIGKTVAEMVEYRNVFRGKRGEAFIYDARGNYIARIFLEAPHEYINEWQVFATFTVDKAGKNTGYRLADTLVTVDGIVLSGGRDELTSESKGVINPSAKAAAEKYRVGNVRIEGDVGAAYAGAILLYLLK